MTSTRPNKAFAYLRVSSTSQTSKDGFRRQEQAVMEYARANGIEIIQTFKEDHTGTQEDRPQLARMIVSMEKNRHGVTTVIIEKLDRLARDLMVQEAIIRDFQGKRFHLISALEGPDLCKDDPTRELIRHVFGAIAQYDKSMLVAKLRASRQRKKILTGKGEGRTGYYETEAGRAIINKIRAYRRTKKYGKRKSWATIAEILNSQGLRTMTGKEWTAGTVHQCATSYARSKKIKPTK